MRRILDQAGWAALCAITAAAIPAAAAIRWLEERHPKPAARPTPAHEQVLRDAMRLPTGSLTGEVEYHLTKFTCGCTLRRAPSWARITGTARCPAHNDLIQWEKELTQP